MIGEVQQPDYGTCLGMVAAMVTGEPFQSVVDFIGHDGKSGFKKREIIPYLLSRGWYYGHGITFASFETEEAPTTQPSFYYTAKLFQIAEALGNECNARLRPMFDELLDRFLAEHELTAKEPAAAPQEPGEIPANIKGIAGRVLQEEARRVKHVRGTVAVHQPAIVTTIIKRSLHALYWDGKHLYDPHHARHVFITDYAIFDWQPVTRL